MKSSFDHEFFPLIAHVHSKLHLREKAFKHLNQFKSIQDSVREKNEKGISGDRKIAKLKNSRL